MDVCVCGLQLFCNGGLKFKSSLVREKSVSFGFLAPFGLADLVERESGSGVYECGPQFVNVVCSCAAFRSAVGAHIVDASGQQTQSPLHPMSLMNEASNRR